MKFYLFRAQRYGLLFLIQRCYDTYDTFIYREVPAVIRGSSGFGRIERWCRFCGFVGRIGCVWDYPCIALHCNFHLRGEESDRDEAFACEFAESLEVPFHKIDFDTISYAGERHLSIEMAARELRYAWFEEMRERLGGQATAVAHHRDDNVETVLMNLIRGTGIRGMSGIRPRNGFIVRPLLCVSVRISWLGWRIKGYAYNGG